MGFTANSIQRNYECLPDGKLLDVFTHTDEGLPNFIKDAICIHEEDGGILYKHTFDGKTTVARSRVLVIHFIATFGNYEYGFYWRFHQDATISLEVGLTGLAYSSLILHGKSPYASRMMPKVVAQHHQHLFNVRLDTMFDGETNSVAMVDVIRAPEEENPFGNGFTTKQTLLKTSLEATTDMNAVTGRTWNILNPNSINPVSGKPVAWKLVPMNQKLLLARPGSVTWNKFRFPTHAVWVTQYRDYELFAAGDYVLHESQDAE